MYRYEDFTSDTIYCIRKNGQDTIGVFFLLHQLQLIYTLSNNLTEGLDSLQNSTLLPKNVSDKLVKMIDTIKKEYRELLTLANQTKNKKISVDFHLDEFLEID